MQNTEGQYLGQMRTNTVHSKALRNYCFIFIISLINT